MGQTRILVATDVRLRREKDGSILSTHPAGLYETFAPLTHVYERVTLLARAAPPSMPTVGSASGVGVELAQVPDFTSVRTLLTGLPRTFWLAWTETGRHNVVFGRLPEPLSLIVGWVAVLRGRPFVANLVADPTSLRLGKSVIGRFANHLILAATSRLVKRSTATIYVTESYLQQRLPPPRRPTLVRSNVRIEDSWFCAPPRESLHTPPRVVLVGSNQSWGKGQRVLLDAADHLAKDGRTIDLTFIGGGRHLDNIRERARDLRLPGEVNVLGQIDSREALAAVLDEQDIFCLPSLSEGLPRAMVEAMARGLPAVGSDVGGIPELLPHDATCPPGDAIALAQALRGVIDDPEFGARAEAAVRTAQRVARQAKTSVLVEFLTELENQRLA